MCGFVGGLSPSRFAELRVSLARMTGSIAHRGPDDEGDWFDANAGIALGHRRLAVVDLTERGHQPMRSPSGRFVIAFNGEIYNHPELRRRIAASVGEVRWRGSSDTETLLAAIEVLGLERALAAAVGMFAFALWDAELRQVSLCRDRFGEKPLYYTLQSGSLLFASELQGITANPLAARSIDRRALATYFRRGVIPAPVSILEGVSKLPPGHLLTVSRQDCVDGSLRSSHPYWSIESAVVAAAEDPFRGTYQDAVDEVGRLLGRAVDGQLLSDVPLGAFLSGGIDSSLVVAMMQAQASGRVNTFSIGFEENSHDEAVHARRVAAFLGTNHSERYLGADECISLVPLIAKAYCEPFADNSQVPTYLLCQFARQSVTVALTGDGGDELFGGYRTYRNALSSWGKLRRIPAVARHGIASVLNQLPGGTGTGLGPLQHFPTRLRQAPKLARLLRCEDPRSLYRTLVSAQDSPSLLVRGATEYATPFTESSSWLPDLGFAEWMMALDAATYLSDDILVKVDQAAMAHGLETRVPILDHRIFEMVWRLPVEWRVDRGRSKPILRDLLYSRVPRALVDRPKRGFSLPLDAWLRGPLRDWAESLLDENLLRQGGYLEPVRVRRMWVEHLSGKRDWKSTIWAVLMFQSWLEGFES